MKVRATCCIPPPGFCLPSSPLQQRPAKSGSSSILGMAATILRRADINSQPRLCDESARDIGTDAIPILGGGGEPRRLGLNERGGIREVDLKEWLWIVDYSGTPPPYFKERNKTETSLVTTK